MFLKWEKPSGVVVETNALEDTIDYCVSLGWKPCEAPKPKKKKVTRKKATSKKAK